MNSPPNLGLTADELDELVRSAASPISLETPVGEDETDQLGDLLPDESAEAPETYALNDALKQETSNLFAEVLTPRQRLVLDLRFGMDGAEIHQLESIGQQLGLTRERVRQNRERSAGRSTAHAGQPALEGFPLSLHGTA